METIMEQLSGGGDPFMADDYENRTFDIHGNRAYSDIPYTEATIAGEALFWSVVHGGMMAEYGSDGYQRADDLILERRARQAQAVGEVRVALLRSPGFS